MCLLPCRDLRGRGLFVQGEILGSPALRQVSALANTAWDYCQDAVQLLLQDLIVGYHKYKHEASVRILNYLHTHAPSIPISTAPGWTCDGDGSLSESGRASGETVTCMGARAKRD